jgi:hypothetical protein
MRFYLVQVEIEYDDALSDNALIDVLAEDETDAWRIGNLLFDADPGHRHPLWAQYPGAVNISVNAVVDGPFDEPQADNFVKVDPDAPHRALLAAFGEGSTRWTVQIEVEVFAEDFPANEPVTPRMVAEAAWDNVIGWVETAYRPVVTVIDGEFGHIRGASIDVDLEAE